MNTKKISFSRETIELFCKKINVKIEEFINIICIAGYEECENSFYIMLDEQDSYYDPISCYYLFYQNRNDKPKSFLIRFYSEDRYRIGSKEQIVWINNQHEYCSLFDFLQKNNFGSISSVEISLLPEKENRRIMIAFSLSKKLSENYVSNFYRGSEQGVCPFNKYGFYKKVRDCMLDNMFLEMCLHRIVNLEKKEGNVIKEHILSQPFLSRGYLIGRLSDAFEQEFYLYSGQDKLFEIGEVFDVIAKREKINILIAIKPRIVHVKEAYIREIFCKIFAALCIPAVIIVSKDKIYLNNFYFQDKSDVKDIVIGSFYNAEGYIIIEIFDIEKILELFYSKLYGPVYIKQMISNIECSQKDFNNKLNEFIRLNGCLNIQVLDIYTPKENKELKYTVSYDTIISKAN